jgi:hypothetical protein
MATDRRRLLLVDTLAGWDVTEGGLVIVKQAGRLGEQVFDDDGREAAPPTAGELVVLWSVVDGPHHVGSLVSWATRRCDPPGIEQVLTLREDPTPLSGAVTPAQWSDWIVRDCADACTTRSRRIYRRNGPSIMNAPPLLRWHAWRHSETVRFFASLVAGPEGGGEAADGPDFGDFEVGGEYTRADIYRIRRIPEDKQGGDCETGYYRYEVAEGDEVFVFANVGAAERTGHAYENRWEGDRLVWYGKRRCKLTDPGAQRLLAPETTVHVFHRSSARGPFTYAGRAIAEQVDDTQPVKVVWRFDGRVEDPDADEEAGRAGGKKDERKGQGRRQSPEERKAIELHAMAVAEEFYDGWNVRDTSANNPFDLECTRADEALRVEVKGTTTHGQTVTVTRGEVESALRTDRRTALFIVSGITVECLDGKWTASGGRVRLIDPWLPGEEDLTPISYSYEVPS